MTDDILQCYHIEFLKIITFRFEIYIKIKIGMSILYDILLIHLLNQTAMYNLINLEIFHCIN